jgi:hypothetical protein
MKISKRIIGIALAIIMIFNVFAVGTFATDMPGDCVVDLVLESDKAVYAPGDTVTLKVSFQVIPEIDKMILSGMFDLAYPSAAVEPSSTTDTLDDHGFIAIADGYDAGTSGVQIPSAASGTSVPGTDSCICYVVGGDESVTFSATDRVELFTVNMKIKADAEPGTYTIGFNPIGYEEYNGACGDGIGLGGITGTIDDYGFEQANLFNFGSVTFTVATPSSKIIFHEDAMYNEDNTTEETAMLGFIGYFNESDIGGFEFVAEGDTKLANVSAVGATIEIVGLDSITRTSQTIHPTATEGVYNFRAVLDSLDLAKYGNAEMKITYFITFDKDGVEDTQYSDTVPTTANAIIAGTF